MKFRTILADPPWQYQQGGRGAAAGHYDTLTPEKMGQWPVASVAAKHCVLMLWTTWPHIASGDAHSLMTQWGFTGKSGFPWLKLSKDMLPRMGTGFHSRAVSELMLIGVKGSPPCPEPWERMEGVLFSRVGAHSAKPDSIYDRAELYDGPYLEMFARPDGGLYPFRPNWTQIGNEITGRDIADDLRLLAETEK